MTQGSTAAIAPSATIAMRTLGSAAVLVAGLLTFIFNGVSLAGHRPTSFAPILFTLTLGLWCLGLTVKNRETAALVCTSAMLILYASPIVLPSESRWIVFGILSTSIVISAAMALPARKSIPLITIALALMSWYAYAPPNTEPIDLHLPVIGGWAAPLFNLSIAIGIGFWRAEWAQSAKDADTAIQRGETLVSEQQKTMAISAARVSVTRSLHETVLNTLGAISAGTAQASVNELRRICREDLERAQKESTNDAIVIQPPPEISESLASDVSTIELMTAQRRLRMAATSAAVFGAITIGFVATSLPNPAWFASAYVLFVVILGALAWWWKYRLILASAAFAVLAFLVVLLVTIEGAAGFETQMSQALDWLINAGAASMILATFAISAHPILRIAFPWTLLIVNVVVVFSLAPADRADPLLSLLATTFYLGAIAYAAVWLFARIDSQRALARELITTASSAEYAKAHSAELLIAWAAVSRASRDLLAGVGSGQLDPPDPEIRQRALVEATILRSRLRLARNPSSGVQASLERILTRAADLGEALDVRVIVPSTQLDGLPQAIEDALVQLIAQSSGTTVAIRVIGGQGADLDELVVTAPAKAAFTLFGALDMEASFPWAITSDDTSDDLARISLTCHDFAMTPTQP